MDHYWPTLALVLFFPYWLQSADEEEEACDPCALLFTDFWRLNGHKVFSHSLAGVFSLSLSGLFGAPLPFSRTWASK